MPGDWRDTTLGDVIELKRGYDLPQHSRTTGDVPLISSSGVTDYLAAAAVRGPGVVTGRYGTLGEVFYIDRDFWPLNTTLYVRDFKGNDPRFIAYFLRGLDFLAYSDKAAVPGLNRNHLHQARVSIPSDVSEQRAIAQILGTLDDKIELNRRMSETLEATARALFKSWFIDFDPVRTKAEGGRVSLPRAVWDLFPDDLVGSDLGQIPLGWRTACLREICDRIFSGGTPSTANPLFWGGGIPWLSSGETRSKLIICTERTITQLAIVDSATRLARAGATVIAGAGQGFTRGQTSLLMIDTYINQSVVALEANRELISDAFLFGDLERRYEQFRNLSDAHSSRGSLTTALLSSLNIVVPPKAVISRFDEIANPCMERIACALRESTVLAQIRDALLPKLISGDIRIKDAEKFLGSVA